MKEFEELENTAMIREDEAMTRKRVAGYVRVSSKEQTEGESLSTQQQSTGDFVKAQGWKLTDIYADEGISGGS
jgi:site-specific DNA recombinase